MQDKVNQLFSLRLLDLVSNWVEHKGSKRELGNVTRLKVLKLAEPAVTKFSFMHMVSHGWHNQ